MCQGRVVTTTKICASSSTHHRRVLWVTLMPGPNRESLTSRPRRSASRRTNLDGSARLPISAASLKPRTRGGCSQDRAQPAFLAPRNEGRRWTDFRLFRRRRRPRWGILRAFCLPKGRFSRHRASEHRVFRRQSPSDSRNGAPLCPRVNAIHGARRQYRVTMGDALARLSRLLLSDKTVPECR